ncbi:hypothetical protein RB625_23280 [Streptomyces californicus]|uniref:hypothetical protein n=1 Tax=Streptomyces californicus TaxID=67351 RepID=UPI00296E7EF5|nr:hypothetical protein [Streptomyces californicus]MDW4901339.1 hypothetical protein [Streptomyces californicus]
MCGPCVGSDLTYPCEGCGSSSDGIYRARLCSRCFLKDQLAERLGGDEEALPSPLADTYLALTGAGRPHSVIYWLSREGVSDLLDQLASTGTKPTHQQFDELASTPATRYVRDLLVAAAVLPPRDEYLEALPRSADDLLSQAPDHHRRIVTPFAHWDLLHRVRRANRGRATRISTQNRTRSTLRRVLELLTWLDDEGTSLDQLTQLDLDRWLDEGSITRRDVRPFITWAERCGLASDLSVPPPRIAAPKTFIKEEERVQQLRHCLSAEDLPGIVRTVGALVLLFGFPYTRLLGLTIHDVIVSGDAVELSIDGHSLRLPPKVDQLLLEQRKASAERWIINQTASTTPWLFPGQEPARPIRSEYLGLLLRRHGFEGLASRNSARLALASDLPASVLADLTGTSISNATRWTGYARRDWLDYIASRTQI